MDSEKIGAFHDTVWRYYHEYGRHDLSWRIPNTSGTFDPYAIVVSEIMLQQTQVPRVLPKFHSFVGQFPSFRVLAQAALGDVLVAWSGLGYNRRAKFLWQAAQAVESQHAGHLPDTLAELVQLPGIGTNTAGAVLAYAFNKPVVFIETNIRTVFITHFFAGQDAVRDREIADAVARTLPDNPREWYWALMDYGSHLKQTVGNASRQSAQYNRQSTFNGSRRQVRGQILKLLGTRAYTADELAQAVPDPRLAQVLVTLLGEGLVREHGGTYLL